MRREERGVSPTVEWVDSPIQFFKELCGPRREGGIVRMLPGSSSSHVFAARDNEGIDHRVTRAILAAMRQPPKSVIHINFIAGPLLFDARPIWTALRHTEMAGKVSAGLADRLSRKYGGAAIHLATRHYIMRRAVEELRNGLVDIYNQVPEPWSVPAIDGIRVVSGIVCERARDRVLLAIDSFLFEFRAYLDLLARFVYGVLTALGSGPSQKETLFSGKTVEIIGKNGRFRPHAFLLYMCEKVSVRTDWYEFLSTYRNFFTHEGAPYCAIEDLMVRPPEFDLIITRANIRDFQHANPSSYFRVSECQAVMTGIAAISAAAQKYVIYAVER